MNQSPIIIFDGICNLCCWWVLFLIKRDTNAKFFFASLQSETGQRMLSSYGFRPSEMETVIYLKGNKCFQKSTAVLEILKDLGGIWSIFSLFKLIPKHIRDYVYQFIARKRYKFFGKRTTCLMPTSELQKRFLS